MSILGKVLIVDNSIDYTGAFKSIRSAADNLSEDFQFYWLLPKRSKDVHGELDHVNYLNFVEINKSWRVLIYIPMLLWNATKILRLIKKHKLNIIHVNDLYNMLGVMVKILNPKIKLIYHVRLLPNSYLRPLYSFFANIIVHSADHIICVSEIVASKLPPIKKITVVFDSVPSKENYAPKEEITKAGKIKILYLGNLIKGKGQDLALKAFSKAIKVTSNLTLTFVGGSPERKKDTIFYKELHDLAGYLGVQKDVEFRNFTSDVEKLIKVHDIVLNLSESESFSMVCLEALYYGTPLIASDCGGPKELFENGKSGILVPNRDVDAAAEAIIKLAEFDGLRWFYGLEGKKFVRQKFDIDGTSAKLRSIYNNLLER